MTRPLTAAEMKAVAQDADARCTAWMDANRRLGESSEAARDRYRAVLAVERRAELAGVMPTIRRTRTAKGDGATLLPSESPLRQWLAVRGFVDPLRVPSSAEHALDHSAAHLIRDAE